MKQRLISKDLKLLEAYLVKRVEKGQLYELYNLCLHYSALSLQQDKNNIHACTSAPPDLEWVWNWPFIGQQPNQAKDHWWFDQVSNNAFLMCWQSTTSLSHLYIKEWKLREWQDSDNNLQVPNLCWNCFTSKVHLEFLINFHILEILEF